jgi:isopenicillin N synthase-like dioxygenase
MDTIPVIDIARLDNDHTLLELDRACRDWGFFQVVNHGIDRALLEAALGSARGFFALPTPTKRSISRTAENPWGFFDQELTKNTRDWKEVFDYGPQHGDVLKPQWPDMPEFKESILDYFGACEGLAFKLLHAISANLSMPAHFLDHLFCPDHSSFVRINYYPSCPNPESPEGTETPSSGHMGVNHHTDAGAVTILLQDQQPGLEVFHDGEWHLVPPVEGALVINIGDIVQVWSNDRYFAALHRVRANSEAERFSVPFFFNPAYSANYEPLPGTVSCGDEAHYTTINWGKFRKLRVDGDYADLGSEIQISDYRKEVKK